MFNQSTKQRDIKTVRQGETNFILTDGFVTYPRATIHILPQCPWQIRDQINFAMAKGYIQMVAHVQGKELTWQELTK